MSRRPEGREAAGPPATRPERRPLAARPSSGAVPWPHEEAWRVLGAVCEAEGVSLYDVDPPKGRAGVLRVYVYRGEPRASTAGIEACVAVSRRILDGPEADVLLPGDTTLEVSSPGVNRRLRRPEHFAGAAGESVKVTYGVNAADGAQKRTVRGVAVGLTGDGRGGGAGDGAVFVVEARPVVRKAARGRAGERARPRAGPGDREEKVAIPLAAVTEARVDFRFGAPEGAVADAPGDGESY